MFGQIDIYRSLSEEMRQWVGDVLKENGTSPTDIEVIVSQPVPCVFENASWLSHKPFQNGIEVILSHRKRVWDDERFDYYWISCISRRHFSDWHSEAV